MVRPFVESDEDQFNEKEYTDEEYGKPVANTSYSSYIKVQQ